MYVPRFNNTTFDSLANATARFMPLRDGFSIEILYKLAVPDNITNLCVFNDDQQILEFMENAEVFKDAAINEEEHDKTLQDEVDSWKGNTLPKGVVSLEIFFDLQNRFRGPPNAKMHSSTLLHEQINLKTESDPKYVNMGT